jgi:hypothetical protein
MLTSAQVVDAVLAYMKWPENMTQKFRRIPGPPCGARLRNWDLQDVLDWMDEDLGDVEQTSAAANYMFQVLRIYATDPCVPPAACDGGGSDGCSRSNLFNIFESSLHAQWRGELFAVDGQYLRAKLPSFSPDSSLDDHVRQQQQQDDTSCYGLFRDEAANWVYPASADPPSLWNGTHLCAAVVQTQDNDVESVNDFAIRVCVYLTGMPAQLIPRLKSAASRLNERTRESIMTFIPQHRYDDGYPRLFGGDGYERCDGDDCDFVSKFLKCPALLQEARMQESDVNEPCRRYAALKSSPEMLSSFPAIARRESPWDKAVTLPLFNPIPGSDDGSKCLWLNVERFLLIFSDYLGPCTAEVRVMPPWGRDAFGPAFQKQFFDKAQHGFLGIDMAFSQCLFQRSVEDRLKRSSSGVPEFVTAVSLLKFNQFALQGSAPAAAHEAPFVVHSQNVHLYELHSQHTDLERILGAFFFLFL